MNLTNPEYELNRRYPRKGKFFACKNCGSEQFGRSNKTFCDTKCRNEFNNASRKRKAPPHRILSEVETNNDSLKEIYLRFGNEPLPARILDSFDFYFDAPSQKIRSKSDAFHAYLDYAMLWDQKKDEIVVERVQNLPEKAEKKGLIFGL